LNTNQIEALKRTIYQAGAIIKYQWNKPRQITHKGKIDLVTDTDLAVEKFLIDQISQTFPQATFIAEETNPDLILGKETFIIDPLDGTTNFAHKIPFVAISVAYAQAQEIVWGAIYAPILDEFFWAQKGLGSFLNQTPISVSNNSQLEKSLIATGFPYSIQENATYLTQKLKNVLTKTQGVRRAGAAAIDLAYTACGRFEGFYEIELKPWDTAAGWLLVEEAGGMVTDFKGNPYQLGQKEILASNGSVHQELLSLLA